tara:strand:- start:15 stop:476 length:462 start_codon:yes stop_codon:yes gene_type:complete
MKRMTIKTQIGWIIAYEENNKISCIKFSKRKAKGHSSTILLKNLKKNFQKYFSGRINYIKTKYKFNGNKIQKKVWNEIKRIEFGKTKSYGEIAKKYNLSPRHIGKICGQNKLPLIIPCHRVIKSDKTLGGFSGSGGTNLKKRLLNFEGHKLQS